MVDLEAWLRAVVATPGMTSLALDDARAALLDDALRALTVVDVYDGPVVDVGSGNGSPGVPLAAALAGREFVLLEAEQRRCEFLEAWASENTRVVRGRAEEQPVDWAGVALAKALAPPPVAAEWCLPLVRPGGVAILWIGERVDLGRLDEAVTKLAAKRIESPDGLAVLEKTGATPLGFPRRTGVARKRPLA